MSSEKQSLDSDTQYKLLWAMRNHEETQLAEVLNSLDELSVDVAIQAMALASKWDNGCKLILNKVKDINAITQKEPRDNLLGFACSNCSPMIVKEILDRGANLNTQDWNGYYPLFAVALGRLDFEAEPKKQIMDLLLSKKECDPNLKVNGKTVVGELASPGGLGRDRMDLLEQLVSDPRTKTGMEYIASEVNPGSVAGKNIQKNIQTAVGNLVEKELEAVSQLDLDLAQTVARKFEAVVDMGMSLDDFKPTRVAQLTNLILHIRKGDLSPDLYLAQLKAFREAGLNSLATCFGVRVESPDKKNNKVLNNADTKKMLKELDDPIKNQLKVNEKAEKAEAKRIVKQEKAEKKAEAQLERKYKRSGWL